MDLEGKTLTEVEKLEYLSLVSKITSELQNHTGMADRVLAEFIINLHTNSKDFNKFKSKLNKIGAEFPESFISTLDRLILTLRPKALVPSSTANSTKSKDKDKSKSKSKDKDKGSKSSTKKSAKDDHEEEGGEEEKKDDWMDQEERAKLRVANAKFPGLAMKDDKNRVKEMLAQESGMKKDASSSSFSSSSLSEFEKLLQSSKTKQLSNDNDEDESSPARKRRKSRSPSPSRSRYPNANNNNKNSSNSYNSRQNQIDESPVLYKIYQGKVTGTRDFGAFVSLEGLRSRFEGMVHIRYVPIISLTHTRISPKNVYKSNDDI
jgi:ATP-dependent RNA helicase DHX8/PRP22